MKFVIQLILVLNLLHLSNLQSCSSANFHKHHVDSMPLQQNLIDTFVYDLNQLRDRLDREPIFYLKPKGIGLFNPKASIKLYLESTLGVGIVYARMQSLSFYHHSQNGFVVQPHTMLKSISGKKSKIKYRPDIKYKSLIEVDLDHLGEVHKVSILNHRLSMINKNILTAEINKMLWQPALKNLVPVRSNFILEIEFNAKTCAEELWYKKKKNMHHFFKSNKEELIEIYETSGVRWEMDLITPMLKVKSKEEILRIFNEVELISNNYINHKEAEFLNWSNKNSEASCEQRKEKLNKLLNLQQGYYRMIEKELMLKFKKSIN